ncbi:hypothetical protein, partial [Enterobacter hormaechei]|uniref:hypothetical protein n=1 Tax=Enterobacter hormaechei TaxID=158836 RepID=UPI001E5DFE71
RGLRRSGRTRHRHGRNGRAPFQALTQINKAMPSEGLSDGILRYFVKVGMTVRVFLTGWIFKVLYRV